MKTITGLIVGIIAATIYGVVACIVTVFAVVGMLVWFSVTWPWYLWKGAHRVAHPR
jgi:hypothetical protein